mmetsp:Transcript_56554/g.175867  ORF Transcript_56554/g.175867 Transcript_56554/m.175867 type:complete len:296 (-) Transcript_56554:157-1044(-)
MARSRRALLAAGCALAVVGYAASSMAHAAFAAPPTAGPGGSAPGMLFRGSTTAQVGVAGGFAQHPSPAGFVGRAAFAALALAFVASSARSGDACRATASARRARVVTVEVENTVPLSLESGSVSAMDAFMAENATEVTLQNLERMEDKPGEPGVKLCYLEPTDFGPFRSQMRLTVRVDLPQSGRCDIAILNMENGSVDKKTGKVTFPDAKENASNFKFDTSNIITWKEGGASGLELMNVSKAKSETILPMWFPLPDGLMQALTSTFVRKIISSGQEKVMDQMKLKFAAWELKQKA